MLNVALLLLKLSSIARLNFILCLLFFYQLLVLSDLFVDGTHFEWVLETLLELHHNHSTEDDLLIQYLLPTLCKALAFLKTVRNQPPVYHSHAQYLTSGGVHQNFE